MTGKIPAFLLCITAWTSSLSAQEKMLFSPYYPLRPGTQWTYRANGGQIVVLRVAKFDKVDKHLCAVLETRREGLPITEHLGVQNDGIYRYKALGFTLDPPLCVLKLPPTKGATWSWNSKMGVEALVGKCSMDEVEVTVPAGKYTAYAVTAELQRGDQKIPIVSYFARGVGMVKQTQKFGEREIVLELEKFEEGK